MKAKTLTLALVGLVSLVAAIQAAPNAKTLVITRIDDSKTGGIKKKEPAKNEREKAVKAETIFQQKILLNQEFETTDSPAEQSQLPKQLKPKTKKNKKLIRIMKK